MSNYVTRQSVLEEAGLSHVVTQEVPALGVADATNRVFVVQNTPMSDTDYNDTVDISDVIAYVNGTAVSVSSVVAATGTVTLTAAPSNGSQVLFTYRYQNMPNANIDDAIAEASDLINITMSATDTVPYTVVPPTVRKIARVYAAGLLLTRDYGSNANTANTSKDGYKKLELVEGKGQEGKAGYQPGWLARYLAMGGQSGGTPTNSSPDVYSDPNIFDYYDSVTGTYVTPGSTGMSPDQIFMLGLDMDC